MEDKKLIGLLVCCLNAKQGSRYALQSHPDQKDRQTKAVDAVYSDPTLGTLAIEHTRVEPFEDSIAHEKGPFHEVWEPLKELSLPEHHIWLRVPLKGVEKGSDWKQAGSVVKDWFLRERANFPLRDAFYEIPGLHPPLPVTVWKQYIQSYPGMVSIASWDERLGDPSRSIVPRLKTAIEEKLPKLCRTLADRHILLLELVDRSLYNLWSLAAGIETLRSSFPALETIEVWVTDDSRSSVQGTPSFCRLQDGEIVCAFNSAPVVPMIRPL